MKRSTIIAVTLPMLCGTAVYFARTAGRDGRGMNTHFGEPRADFPARLDLGPRELGEEVSAEFSIANVGKGLLVVGGFRANCSCSSLEQEIEGEFIPVRELQLVEGASARLRLRIAIRAIPNDSLRNSLQFVTNDPSMSSARIDFVVPIVMGGVTTVPTSITFGRVLTGTNLDRVVDVYDSAKVPRTIVRVISSDPDKVRVKLMPAKSHSEMSRSGNAGLLIGQVAVEVLTELTGPIEAIVDLYCSDRIEPSRLVVSGHVSDPIEMQPRTIILQRKSENGLVYSCRCLLRSIDEQPFELTVNAVPETVTARIVQTEGPAPVQFVDVQWHPRRSTATEETITLVLRAQLGKRTIPIELPVICRREPAR